LWYIIKMNTFIYLRKHLVLPLIAAMALATVALVPQTGWLVQPQIQAAVGIWPESEWRTLTDIGIRSEDMSFSWIRKMPQDAREVAIRQTTILGASPNNNDIGMQIAGTLTAAKWAEFPERLRKLAKKYPNSPEVCATILRFTVTSEARLNPRNQEGNILKFRPATNYSPPKPNDPVATERFIRDALRGEQLAPQNAYFPLMRSIGLLALKRDEEALIALHKAAQCPEFTDYTSTEALGRLKFREALSDKQKAIVQLTYLRNMQYPHYSSLRAGVRLATAIAVKKELAGDRIVGMAIRRDIIAVSQKIQGGSCNFNGYFTGLACEQTAFLRPGGALPIKSKSETERLVLREAQWRDYALRQGATDLAERPALNRVKPAFNHVEEEEMNSFTKQEFIFFANTLNETVINGVVASALLTTASMFLLIGGIFQILLRFTRLGKNKPAEFGVTCGLGIGIVTSITNIIIDAASSDFFMLGFIFVFRLKSHSSRHF
jgi:hypothetical protein